METKPWYDDEKRISALLKSSGLEGLTRVIEARKGNYERGQVKPETDFMFFGRIIQTWKGELSIITRSAPKENYPSIPDVLPAEKWDPFFGGIYHSHTIITNINFLPHHLLRCPHCGLGWSLKNIHDFRALAAEELQIPLALDIGNRLGLVLAFRLAIKEDAIYFPHPHWVIVNKKRDQQDALDDKPKREYADHYIIESGDELGLQRISLFHQRCLKEHLLEKRTLALEEIFNQAGYTNTVIRFLSKWEHPTDGTGITWLVRTEIGMMEICGTGDHRCWKAHECKDNHYSISLYSLPSYDWRYGVHKSAVVKHLKSLRKKQEKRTKK